MHGESSTQLTEGVELEHAILSSAQKAALQASGVEQVKKQKSNLEGACYMLQFAIAEGT